MNSTNRVALLSASLLVGLTLISNETKATTKSELFESQSILRFELMAPFAEMKSVSKRLGVNVVKSHKFDGTLSYTDRNGKDVKLSVRLSMKGFTSISMCPFPKMEMKINEDGQNTIFRGIKKVDLKTHCADPQTSGDNKLLQYLSRPHREVVAYRILELLNLPSYATKPVLVRYTESTTGTTPESASNGWYQAFFIQDKSEYKKQFALTEVLGKNDSFKTIAINEGTRTAEDYRFQSIDENMDRLNTFDIAKVEVVQNLIGNRDWFMKANAADLRFPENPDHKNELWNIRIFEDQNHNWLTMAYDFNLSALNLIETAPASGLPYPIAFKAAQLLTPDARKQLRLLLVKHKDAILNELDFLKDDPEYQKLRSFLEIQIDHVAHKLQPL